MPDYSNLGVRFDVVLGPGLKVLLFGKYLGLVHYPNVQFVVLLSLVNFTVFSIFDQLKDVVALVLYYFFLLLAIHIVSQYLINYL